MKPLLKLTAVEARLFLRDPGAVIYGLLFPSGLLLGLGAIPILREPSPEFGGVRFVDFWAPSALVMGVLLIGAQHVPILIATYRDRGILRRLSTTPVHPGKLLAAQMIVAFVFLAASALLLILSAWAVLGVQPPARPFSFTLAFLVGFAAVLGISLINAAVARNAAAATSIGTVIFMVLMLFAGAFLPRFMLPEVMVRIGDYLPPGVQALLMTWSPESAVASGYSTDMLWLQLTIMVVIAVVSGSVAAKFFRWE